MARLPNPGGDDGTWGDILNTFLGQVHKADGTLKDDSVSAAALAPNAVDSTVIADGSITPVKLSQTYVQTSAVANPNGVASLDGSGKVPSGQLPTTTTPDATTSSKGIVQLAGDLAGTAAAPTVPGLTSKANTSTTISAGTGLTGGGDLSANRTLTVSYGASAGTAAQGNDSRITGAEQTTNKGAVSGYASLDSGTKVPTAQLGGAGADATKVLRGDQTWVVPTVADATTIAKGSVQLAGDLGGTAAAPTVPGLTSKANTSTTISAGTGLTGGGDLSVNRTLTVSYGASAGTAAQGNDSRITGAEQTTNKGAVSGYASLDSGTKVPTAQLGGAGADNTKFLRGDQTWVVPPATADATTGSKGVVQLTNDLGGTATAPTVLVTHLSSALPVNQGGTGSTTQNFVDLTTPQSVGGVKTFTSAPVVPSSSFPESAITNLTTDLATIPSVPQPSDNYLYGWTGPPEFFVSNVAPTATEVYLQRIIVTTTATINNLYLFVTSAGSGMTANRNFVGLYNTSGTRLGVSADCSSSWTSTHVAKIALTSGVSVTKGQIIYASMLFTGTSMPQMAGGAQGYWDLPSVGNGVANWASASPPYNVLAPNRFRYMSWSVGETALPASLNLDNGNPDKAFWVGIG